MKSTCFGKKLKRILGGIIICSLPFIYYACKPCNCNTPCPDDPTPTPTPTDTIPTTDTIPDTPIIDTTTYPDTIFVPFKWNVNVPNEDTIEFYKDKNGVKVILMVAEPLSHEEQINAGCLGVHANNVLTNVLWDYHERAPNKIWGRGDLYFPNFPSDPNSYLCGALQSDTARLNYLGYKTHRDIPQGKTH